jgi:PilZ domain
MNSSNSARKSSPVRQFKRLRYPPDLAVKYEGHDMPIRLSGPDISTQGMFINTPCFFPEGAVLEVSFSLTRLSFKVRGRCEVRYCLPGVGVGVEFIDLPAEAHRAIERELQIGQELSSAIVDTDRL